MRTVATIDKILCTAEITACVHKCRTSSGIDEASWHWNSCRRHILKDLISMIQNWKKQEWWQDLISYAVLNTNIAAPQRCEPNPVCLANAQVSLTFLSIKKHIVTIWNDDDWFPLKALYWLFLRNGCTCVNIWPVGKLVSPLWQQQNTMQQSIPKECL